MAAETGIVPDVNDETSNFDILAKWENQQKTSFFKTTKKSFPMYPFMEEKVRMDDYGEIIRPDDYIIAAKLEPRKNSESEQDNVKKEEEDEEMAEPVVEEHPTKCVEFKRRTEVLCRVEFIEYEGIADGESTKRLLLNLMPRQVIIIHGSGQDTRELASYFRDNGMDPDKIEAPNAGQWVDASVESYIYQVALSDAILADINFHEAPDGNALAWIDARIIEKESMDSMISDQADTVPQGDNEVMEVDENKEEDEDELKSRAKQHSLRERLRGNLMLEVLTSKEIPCHEAVYVNDPKLSEFKNVLVEKGYKAEFQAGSLQINGGAFSIRRADTGSFSLEGAFSKDYYSLRNIFYEQFAVL
ncbi:unnamed protein product [Caenorhabditis auriculariae]|uniref:Cleavage and polyadenylation specificity factor subunit 2 n=1 Tax=Caenorhabditis auriculariae TaxID=2777116 RepID=A0A8S1H1C1_9PELO|nr:unnamed protein product [Caenorhabditis auriculariae]